MSNQRKTKHKQQQQPKFTQEQFKQSLLEQSNLDKRIPLGYPPKQMKTERGPTAQKYYFDREKAGFAVGRYWGLHWTGDAPRRVDARYIIRDAA